ncbi:hypothetical protein V4C53_02245 [Paraburkholderia azotifigens]|uniref:hypothetical protein n=1 Tax=Paraburkholderia azotifigens TaxID=2057004 RepID=UPI003181CDC8
MKRNQDRGVYLGDGHYVSPAHLVAIAGFLLYQAKDVKPDIRQHSRHILDAVLSAARAGGFAKGDILETKMYNGDDLEGICALADEATRVIGDSAAFIAVLLRAGLGDGGVQ